MSFSVFVGNIPYDATEEQLKEVFGKVGPVHSFRLMVDRETAKPKGFGFCEYSNAEAAASAIRNLNNAEFHGRPLRVDSTSEDGDSARRDQARSTQPGVDMIKKLILSMSRAEMVDILAESQKFMLAHPESAKQLLTENPAVSQTLLQILVIFELVKKEDIVAFAPAELPRDVMRPPPIDRWAPPPPEASYSMRGPPPRDYGPPPPPPRGVPPPPPRNELELPPLGHPLNPYERPAPLPQPFPPSFPPPMPRPGMRELHPGIPPRMDPLGRDMHGMPMREMGREPVPITMQPLHLVREREGQMRDRDMQQQMREREMPPMRDVPMRELQPMHAAMIPPPAPPRETPPPSPAPATGSKTLSEEHKKLLQQIPNLKPEDIAKLPEKVQQQVLLLKKLLAQQQQKGTS